MGGVVRAVVPKKPAPVMPSVQTAPTRAEVSQATSTASTDIARGQGRSSMIVTGPQGLGSGDLKLKKRTLLG